MKKYIERFAFWLLKKFRVPNRAVFDSEVVGLQMYNGELIVLTRLGLLYKGSSDLSSWTLIL